MELVEDPTLADRIAEGPIPLYDTIAIARQIAEALHCFPAPRADASAAPRTTSRINLTGA
jgi:hypothetical protein